MTRGTDEEWAVCAAVAEASHGTSNYVNFLVCHLSISFYTPLEAQLVVRSFSLLLLIDYEQLVMDQGTGIIFDRFLVFDHDKKDQKLHKKPRVQG